MRKRDKFENFKMSDEMRIGEDGVLPFWGYFQRYVDFSRREFDLSAYEMFLRHMYFDYLDRINIGSGMSFAEFLDFRFPSE